MSVFRQSAVILVLGWALMPLSFVTSAAVARALGPEGRGILFLMASLTTVLVTVTGFGMNSAATVIYRRGTHPPGEIVGSVLVVVLGSSLAVLGIYTWLSQPFLNFFLGEVQTFTVDPAWMAIALAMVPVTILLELADVLLIAEDAMKTYALRNTGTQLTALVLTWGLIFTGHAGITTILAAQALSLVFGLLVFLGWFVRRHGLGTLRCTRAALRDLFRIGVQQFAVSLVAAVGKRADAFIIARLLSLQDAGYYAIASTVQNLFVNIPRSALWPLVSTLSGKRADRHEVLARACRVLTLVMAVAGLAFMAISPLFVELVFGAAFLPATAPVCFALISVVAAPTALAASALFTADGQPARLMVASIPATIVRLVANFALVPVMGASGSALALTANSFTVAVIHLYQIQSDGVASVRELLFATRADIRLLTSAVQARLRRRTGTSPQGE